MAVENFLNYEPQLDKTSWVHQSAPVIGRCQIGKDTSIWPNTVIRADIAPIYIGHSTNIQDNTVIHVTHESVYAKQHTTALAIK